MTDDPSRTTRTGEHDCSNTDDEIDPVFGLTAGELRMVDAFLYEVAMEAAMDPRPPTADELEAIEDLRVRAERLKSMTPEELAAERERQLRVMGPERR